jgi:CDP-4-dehydro-6-deoxyglucose reductase, E3
MSAALSFNVSVLPSNRSFTVTQDEPILTAGIRQGVALPYGCKDGACGSCKCKILEGKVVHGPHQPKALSAEEEAAGYILTCCGKPQSDIVLESRQVTSADAFPIKRMPSRVISMEKKSHDVMVIQLQLPASDTMQYKAGQYIEFIMRDGARRSYSMASAPHIAAESKTLQLHIRHMPGGKFTDHVFGEMKEKEIQRIEGPFGSFHLHEDSDKAIVLLASGTGFAPIKAIIQHMQHQGVTRPATLYWGGRRPVDLYMNDWVLAQIAAMPNLTYVPVISNALPEDEWIGRTGFVHQAVIADFPDLSNTQVYACGAPIVIDSAHADFVKLCKLPEDEFYADSFITEADKAKT